MATMRDGRVRSVRRVFPSTHPTQFTITTRLSIVDATVARFSPCGAIWFYDRAEGLDANDPTVSERFQKALSETLDGYPHYAGQLRWATVEDMKGTDNPRFLGRPIVTYGSPNDPGVELVLVEDTRELRTIVPSLDERSMSKRVWKASGLRQSDFLPGTKLAFSNLAEYTGLPGVAAQITIFKCGGFAIGVKITHCLSDAICLLQFVHSWADRTRKLFDIGRGAKLVTGDIPSKVLFDPSLLDAHAKLDPQASEPDGDRIDRARSLPMHRFDWWATEAPSYPPWATASSSATQPSPDELSHIRLSPSTHPPWPTWDMGAPVEHVQVRFSKDEIARMKAAAMNSLPDHSSSPEGQIVVSRQDALLAHLWILINRARARARQMENLNHDNNNNNNNRNNSDEDDGHKEEEKGQVYMDITLGIRNRVSPPLPDSFAGSPILLAHVARPGVVEAAATPIGAVAAAIRQMMSRFTSQAVSDYLYEAAHEVSPQRLWQAFLGSRHVLVTSWARARAYEVDFLGTGPGLGQARYVQSHMPLMDGLLQLMDIADTGDFDVSLALQKDTMQSLLDDPMLRAYEKS